MQFMQKTANRSRVRFPFRLLSKTLLIMRLTSCLLLGFCLHVSAKTSSQNISFSERNAPLKKVFSAIKKQTGFVVFSNRVDLEGIMPISISVKKIPLDDFLKAIFKDRPLGYTIEDRTIMLFRKSPDTVNFSVELSRDKIPDANISGTVINAETKEPIGSVSVSIKGQKIGTSSDINGIFTLNNIPLSATLVFSSIGYAALEVKVADLTSMLNGGTSSALSNISKDEQGLLVVSLSPKNFDLDNIVVIGYGTQKRKDVTGAIASVTTKDFNKGINIRPIQQLQGKVAGLVVTQPDGDPNGELIIRLRGQASLTGGQTPLIVIDGIPLDDPNQLSYLSPGDIVSYDVLKDASASAIYGSRAANGVIMVTTKKGRAGKSQVDYSGIVAFDKLAKKYDLLNAEEYKEAISDAAQYYDKGGNTDWFDAITRTGLTQTHNLAISGGTDKFNFRASGTYIDQRAIVINSGRQETRLNFNAEKKALNDKLVIKAGIISSSTNRKYAHYDIFSYATNSPPTYPVYNDDGSYFAFFDWAQQNPVAMQMMEKNVSNESFNIFSSSIDYSLLKHLKLGVTGALSKYNRQYSFFQPELPGVGNINNGSRSAQNRDSKRLITHADYFLEKGRNTLSATAVFEYNYFTYNTYSASGQDYLVEDLEDNALETGNALYNAISSYKDEFKLASVLGRVAYNYDSRYYITASFRRDGSSKFGRNNRWGNSKFGRNNRWGNFPSVSAAWRLSREDFLKHVDWISELKITAGYGVTGNQEAITPYNTLLSLGGAGNYYDGASGTFRQQYTPNQNQNKDLKWEERHGKNIGVEFSLFSEKLNGSINVFNDKTKNLLFTYSVPVPPFYVGSMLANVGTMSNKGVELQLNASLVKRPDFSWNASGQITFLKTRILSLSGSYAGFQLSTDHIPSGYPTGRGYAFNPITYLQEGYTPNVFFLPHFVGINDQGIQMYDDRKEGQVPSSQLSDEISRYIDPSPNFNYGISNTFSYRSWSFNFFLRGVSGGKIFDNTTSLISNYTRLPGANVSKDALTNGIRDQLIASDLWLKDGSYLRLDNATLTYTFRNVDALNNLSLFITGSNLFVITKYTGLDPEVNLGRIDVTYGGRAFYPRTRSVNIGVNVSFK